MVQSVCHSLQEKGIQTGGFYTEEIRQGAGRGRTGFDVVTLDGKRAPLARLNGYGWRQCIISFKMFNAYMLIHKNP